jgi:TPR repeat protein
VAERQARSRQRAAVPRVRQTMTVRVIRVLSLLLAMCAAPSVCEELASAAQAKPTTEIGGIGSDYFDIAPDCIAPLERDALRGSLPAAKRLCDYHAAVTDKASEVAYWCEIAAVNSSGDAQEELNVGMTLSGTGGSRGRQRAVFWLRRAEAHGMAAASAPLARLLRDMGE